VNQGGRLIDSFLEGPVFDEGGNLYVADIPFGRERAVRWVKPGVNPFVIDPTFSEHS
jgi:hypothetical protein